MGFDTDTRLDFWGDFANVFPSPMDGWINSALSGFEDVLSKLAGDPEALSVLHTVWTADQDLPGDLAQEQGIHRQTLLLSWDAASRSGFDTNMAMLEKEIQFLGENFASLADLLKESAEATIATINAIVDMLSALLVWALAEAFVAIASSLITFGASVAGWFGVQAIQFGVATTRMLVMLNQLVAILTTIVTAIRTAAATITAFKTGTAIAVLLGKAVPEITQATGAADGF